MHASGKIGAAALLGLGLLALSPSPRAEARIVCENEFQIVQGSPVATPLCADRYLARVARNYGMRVSEADLRNPSVKRRVCAFIGNDNRVYSICSGWRPHDSNPSWGH
ncbi:MAG TPA: hypothetical protein VG900_07205 [Hyphomicrobiaceae bacterium]|nr:hypothetical protein [Hyphomicrobiaceae bacterium]